MADGTNPPTGNGSRAPGFAERRTVTILFCDVVNSTAMAEQLDPEDWVEIMKGAFEKLTTPVERFGGTVNKLMGDAVLAIFGAPAAHEDDPVRAVLAGLEILSAIADYRSVVRRAYGLDFQVRVGINTGGVVMADVGSGRATDHTAMGDAVNIAARMEQTAAPGTLQVSAETWRLIGPLFEAEKLAGVELKGKSEPVDAWRILGVKAEPGRLRGIDGVSARLVGREAELAALREAMNQPREGRGHIIHLIGEAGLGKSRLLAELEREWKLANPGGRWDVMTAVPYDSTRPFALFQNFARHLFGVDLDAGPEEVHRQLQEALRTMGADEQSVQLCSVAFGRVIAAKVLAGAQSFTADVVRDDIYTNMLPGLRIQAQAEPTVIVADDLHWADSDSVDLMIHLTQLVEDTRILFIGAFRPERQAPVWRLKSRIESELPHRLTQVYLKPLPDADADTLVSELLTIADLPPELRSLILRKAEGNPYFVEEIVRTLIDDGIVYRTDDGLRWKATTRVEDIAIPDNLQALLMARIDRLDQEAKATLQVASVIGRSFYYRILQAISDKGLALDRHLGSLERTELVLEAARKPELEYAFRHELARDAAYTSILNRRRRDFHRRVGEAIEQVFHDRVEEHAHRLAQHFLLAGEDARAVKYLEMAGDNAAGLNAGTAGAEHYGRAIEAARRSGAPDDVVARLTAKRAAVSPAAPPAAEAVAGGAGG